MKKFWILWNPEGKTPPTVKFASFEAASKTADAMQKRIGVGTMYVMEVVAGCEVKQTARWAKVDK
jgi:hypothetical protein